MTRKFAAAFLMLLTFGTAPLVAEPIRIKDLVEFDGVRANDLVGYGLVVGLNGTGDGLRNAPFTEEMMANLLERLGVNVAGEDLRPKNVAAVFVTATLPAFARAGALVDARRGTCDDGDGPPHLGVPNCWICPSPGDARQPLPVQASCSSKLVVISAVLPSMMLAEQ